MESIQISSAEAGTIRDQDAQVAKVAKIAKIVIKVVIHVPS